MLLCTLDITSLYKNIPHNEGTQAIKEFLAIHRDTNVLPHNSYITELLKVVLTNNYFDFNCKHYHQKSETAMGTKLAPSYVNLFMTKFEQIHVYTYHLQPTLWKRFIDDIFMIWHHGMDSVLEFIQHLNTVHRTIKFTSNISPSEIAFLDLIIYSIDVKLYTKLHTKSTDRHMYLNFHSEHPMNLKRSIPYSQFLRLKSIHYVSHYLIQAQIQLYLYLIWREYPHDILIEAWRKTNGVIREKLLSDTAGNQNSTAPLMFITTYKSANPNFRELTSKHWSYLGRSSATRELGKQDIMVKYRKPPSLKDILVRAKIPQPRSTTSKGCTRPNTCQYCTRLSQSGKITNPNNNTSYNTITKGTARVTILYTVWSADGAT